MTPDPLAAARRLAEELENGRDLRIPSLRQMAATIRSLLAYAEELEGLTSPVILTDPTRAFFLRVNELRDLPSPEVMIEEDGDVCFDWDVASDVALSASISATGRVGWSALIKDYKSHGTFQLPGWADELDRALSRFQLAVSR